MSRTNLVGFALSVALVVGCCQFAQAGWVPGFTGNSQFELGYNGPTADGVVSFAVWDNAGGDTWDVDLGVEPNRMKINVLGQQDIGTLHGDAPYIYFYQVVNTDPDTSSEDVLSEFQVQRGIFTEGGFLVAGNVPAVFNEATVAGSTPVDNVNTALDAAGSATGTPTTDWTPGNHIPGDPNASLASTPFVGDASAVTPVTLNLQVGYYDFEFGNGISDNPIGYSAVMYLTSDLAPRYLLGALHDGNAVADGDIPSNTPEPGSFVMVLGALFCGLAAVVSGTRRK